MQCVEQERPTSAAEAQAGRRDASRLRLYLPARLNMIDGMIPCIIEDISRTGARIVIQQVQRIGQSGILECPPLDAFFDRVWANGVRIGVAFEECIPAETLHALRLLHDNRDEMALQELRRTARDWVRGDLQH